MGHHFGVVMPELSLAKLQKHYVIGHRGLCGCNFVNQGVRYVYVTPIEPTLAALIRWILSSFQTFGRSRNIFLKHQTVLRHIFGPVFSPLSLARNSRVKSVPIFGTVPKLGRAYVILFNPRRVAFSMGVSWQFQ